MAPRVDLLLFGIRTPPKKRPRLLSVGQFLPCLDDAIQSFGVHKPLGQVLVCPPGRSRLLRSAAIEDDFLFVWKRMEARLKFIQGHPSGNLDLLAFLVVVITAHQQEFPPRIKPLSHLGRAALVAAFW